MSRRVDAVAFDMDGTVTDSLMTCLISLQLALTTAGVSTPTLDSLRPIVALPLVTSVPDLLAEHNAHGVDVQQVLDAHAECFVRVAREHTVAIDGIDAVLGALHRQVPLAIVTSQYTAVAADVLEHTALGQYFSVIVGSDVTANRKPHAAPLLEACRRLSVDPEKVVVVGDADVDMMMACTAGAFAVGVDWGVSSAQQLIASGANTVVSTPGVLEELCRSFLT